MGMVHAFQQGKLKNPPGKIKEVADRISPEDAGHFASTKHEGLPEKKASTTTAYINSFLKAAGLLDKSLGFGLKALKGTGIIGGTIGANAVTDLNDGSLGSEVFNNLKNKAMWAGAGAATGGLAGAAWSLGTDTALDVAQMPGKLVDIYQNHMANRGNEAAEKALMDRLQARQEFIGPVMPPAVRRAMESQQQTAHQPSLRNVAIGAGAAGLLGLGAYLWNRPKKKEQQSALV